MLDKINDLYKQMLEKYDGGLSSTSTRKFDDITKAVSDLLEIDNIEIYATGSGSRPGNLEVRLSQGVRATIHTTVGLGFIVDEKNDMDNVNKLTNSALVTCRKFLGRGKAHYDNIIIFVESKGELLASGIICQKKSSVTDKLIEAFHISNVQEISLSEDESDLSNFTDNDIKYLTAIRTKSFLLLAGISGTGKSRIVRELAFKSCPKYLQDKDETTPGNYCMIEVKPNWHDSTELLGYYSNLGRGYQFKKFVKFLIKAKMFPDVPFFVCLDEMNLAPVEQYFAEILSVLETRKHPKNEAGEVDMSIIKTGVIIEAEYFKALGKMGGFNPNFTDRDIYMKLYDIDTESDIAEEIGSRTDLTTEGLTLPGNVIIIGTVNMDDTTHQFSRKVIDRAMTIEMNGGRLKNMFGGSNDLVYLKEEEQQKWQAAFKQKYVNADEVLKAHADKADEIVNLLPEKLEAINAALKGTPFEVSYLKALGKMGGFNPNFTDRDIYMKLYDIDTESDIAEEIGSRTDLTTEGLTLPGNVIIIGTVNMDDTTHQFSRKVIDRAMTIEMNGGRLKNMFGGSNDLVYLKEEEQQKWQAAFKQKYVNADEVLKAHADKADEIVNLLPEKLEAINAALKGTPFEVSYRVLNELAIMVGVMLDNTPEEELETIVNNALDRILLMKILPRIEGDSDMFNLKNPQKVGDATCRNRLEWLRELAPAVITHDDEGKIHQQTAKEKIEEMIGRLENQEFTRFWP